MPHLTFGEWVFAIGLYIWAQTVTVLISIAIARRIWQAG